MRYATFYWIPTEEEANELVTYGVDHHPMAQDPQGIYKLRPPIEVLSPASTIEGEEEASERWFRLSNKEDLYVLEMEREAFEHFYEKEKKEIENNM